MSDIELITENLDVDLQMTGGGGGGTSDYNDLTNKPKINNETLTGNKSLSDLGIKTEAEIDSKDTATLNSAKAYTDAEIGGLNIPTKLSDLTNDMNVISESAIISKDTAILTSATAYTDTIASTKQNTLTAGSNVSITGNVISATDTTYTAGSGIDITNNVITATGGGGGGTSDYLQLSNKPSINSVTLSGNKTTADLNISYNDLTNKPTIPTVPTKTSDLTNDSGFITSSYHDSTKADTSYVNTQLATKQNNLTAGTGINITGNVISATGSGGTSDYTQLTNKPSINSITLTGNKSLSDLGIQHQLTAGTNITISNNVISATGGGGGGSDIATDTLNNKLESYILRGEVVDINALNTLLENKINGVT